MRRTLKWADLQRELRRVNELKGPDGKLSEMAQENEGRLDLHRLRKGERRDVRRVIKEGGRGQVE